MTGQHRYKRHLPFVVRWGLSVLIVLAVGFGVYLYATRDTSPLPKSLRQQLTFSPFIIPKTSTSFTTSDYKFATAEDKVQILTYIIHTEAGVTVSISEYTQPQEFNEIPEYKDRFLTNVAKQYATVQTANGTIYLGRMVQQNNRQIAVLLERGLIVFLSPSTDLNPSEWRTLGEQLDIQKVAG